LAACGAILGEVPVPKDTVCRPRENRAVREQPRGEKKSAVAAHAQPALSRS
jgi:hypothetical protein